MVISVVNLPSDAFGSFTGQVQANVVSQNSSVTRLAPLSPPQDPVAALRRIEIGSVVQLSSFGQVRSSIADIQNKARALLTVNQSPNLSDFKGIVQAFVQSLNSIRKAVSNLALSGDSWSGETLDGISKALDGSNGGTFSALKELGISQQDNGTFSVDQKQLEKAFQENPQGALSVVSDIADRVTKATDKQLSSIGIGGKKTNNLSARISESGNIRNTARSYPDAQKSSQQSLAVLLPGGYAARNAMATYASVASF